MSARFPVVDGIAFRRADRAELAAEAQAALDAGDREAALVLLLGDQDDWAPGPPPSPEARREAVRRQAVLTLREAMALLELGPVATYFAHRWSDPTFLSGLALAQAYWGAPRRVVELGCGAGHFLRAFAGQAAEVVGGDLVFAKLWLARHWVAPEAQLVCFDAAAPWPFPAGHADLVFCHDAFYFLPDKPFVAREMHRVGRRVLVGHVHNALVDNLSAGAPLPPEGYAALFPGSLMFDDRELTAALIEARMPHPTLDLGKLATVPAIALAPLRPPGVAVGPLTAPAPGTKLRRNPLYGADGAIAWPSERYRAEYAGLATYPAHCTAPEACRAGESPAIDAAARCRELLDLPERW